MIGKRLNQLRLARGLTLEELASKLGGIVTKQALSKYERNTSKPSNQILIKIASVFGVKAAFFFDEPDFYVRFQGYRRKTRMKKHDQERIENTIRQSLEERVRIHKLLMGNVTPQLPIKKYEVDTMIAVEQAAEDLRMHWKLGLAPIANVIDTLEENQFHVLELDENESFDGISATIHDDNIGIIAAAVVTRKVEAGERQRFNLLHELGHLVLKVTENLPIEKASHRFAGAFLAPKEILLRMVGAKRHCIQFNELIMLKHLFGISVQALLYRLHDLDVISDKLYRDCFVALNTAGWKKKEPEQLPPEKPSWLKRSVFCALNEGWLEKEEAETILGEPVKATVSPSLTRRKSFMGRPLMERQQILTEQAKELSEYYNQDEEWRDLDGGDIIEH